MKRIALLRSDVAAVAHLDPLHRDRADPGLDLALRPVAVPDDPVAAVRQLQPFIAARNASASARWPGPEAGGRRSRRTSVSGSSIVSG